MSNYLVLLSLGLAGAIGAMAEGEPETSKVTYRFEAEPSAPLAAYGKPSRDPKLTLRASGAVYLAAVAGSHGEAAFVFSTSSDGGDAFGPSSRISPEGAVVSSHGENSPTLAFGSGIDLYALWEEQQKGISTRLTAAASPAFGRQWHEPVTVTDKDEPSTNAFAFLAAAPDGGVWAAWLDGRNQATNPPGTASVYVARSGDGGRSFGANMAVAHGVCPCCRPTIAFGSSGEVHAAWRHVFPDDIRDVAMATSRDNGKTFGEPVRVARDEWRIRGCPHSGASLAVKDNRLWASWYSDGDGSNPGVRLAWSDDAGASFSKPVIVSAKVLDANHPHLSLADDGRLLLVFQGRDPGEGQGWGPAAPYLVEIAGAGAFTAPIRVPGSKNSISYPQVAGGTLGRVFVAWTEKDGQGQQQVMLSRGRRSPAQ